MARIATVANTRRAPRLWSSLSDVTRHRLACLVAQILRQELRPEPNREDANAERGRN